MHTHVTRACSICSTASAEPVVLHGLRHPSALLVNGEYLAAWRWHTDRGARLAGSIKSLTSAWTTRREERN